MLRRRKDSSASSDVTIGTDGGQQELGNMYDYLAKVILLGPSGTGKSCLLHRFVKNEWRVISSQTIGVEFASKIVRVGTGRQRKRIKLQLWDTAGTERFRSVSRSYYRGAAGAILVYDVTNYNSFRQLGSFLSDARALGSPGLAVLLAGNKLDVVDPDLLGEPTHMVSGSWTSGQTASSVSGISPGLGSQQTATVAGEGRQVSAEEASHWATYNLIPAAEEVSAYSGENVEELFNRLARTILMKVELGEVDPGDPQSGVQYGDTTPGDDGSLGSGASIDGSAQGARRGRRRTGTGMGWDGSFRPDGRHRRRDCC